jgi:hypothetical protein
MEKQWTHLKVTILWKDDSKRKKSLAELLNEYQVLPGEIVHVRVWPGEERTEHDFLIFARANVPKNLFASQV